MATTEAKRPEPENLPGAPAGGSDDSAVRDGEPVAAAPRPPTPDDIERMLSEASARASARPQAEGRGLEVFSLALLWSGVIVAVAAAGYLLLHGAIDPAAALSAIAFLLGAGVVIVGVCRPDLLASFFTPSSARRRVAAANGGELASIESLVGLGVAEAVLAADVDAWLITRRDGVVAYANNAYRTLALEAGLGAGATVPPRIDRLFAQQGKDASKVYRLCRAARAGQSAEEIVFQRFGVDHGGAERRFQVSASPIEGASPYVAWRVKELPIERRDHDALEMAYADVPTPICAIDRAGRIATSNAAMRKTFGLGDGVRTLDEIVLGETSKLVDVLWKNPGATSAGRVRIPGSAGADAVFRAFRRGGVGEGSVYVAIDIAADEEPEVATGGVSGELTEAPFGVAIVEGDFGRDAKIVEANQAFLSSFEGAAKGATLARIMPLAVIGELAAESRKRSTAAPPRPIDAEIRDVAGQTRTFSVYARPLRRRRGGYGVKRTFLYSVEITEQKRMQEDHVQDQKLKAIGNIAGEVAHDFNNLLQVVLSSCEDLLVSHPAGDPAYTDLLLIRQNAQRAANLTRQLLAYSRKQTLTSRSQSITDLLIDFSRFLDRAVGEKVRVKLKNGRGLPLVRIDTNQFETAIMNLAVNARDAMAPDGGELSIETEFVPRDGVAGLGLNQLRDQDHVLVRVSDTGPGVPDDLKVRIFDPFFTTKEIGKGTGLGLSAVQGVIEQMGGAITVDDAPTGGATFRIYLPAYHPDEAPAEQAQAVASAPAVAPPLDVDYSGVGRILVVEDEPGVRLVVVKTLQKAGYDVDVADDGVEALEKLADDATYDLVITDVMMPEVDGPTMVAEARENFGLKAAVVFMSGYAEAAVREQLDAIDSAFFIQKPFQKSDLSMLVRRAIHGED
ncbi:MAG: response regulator [Alphaproteobacteria bacterium]|nr:response regulator [Alphaproteobacteria bacterium]